MMRTLMLAAVLAAGCSSKAPKETPDASSAEPAVAAPPAKPAAAPSAAGLKKISETVAGTCAAEFGRAAKDKLQPGPAQPCELGVNPELIYSDSASRPSLEELAESMKAICANLQKDVDGA